MRLRPGVVQIRPSSPLLGSHSALCGVASNVKFKFDEILFKLRVWRRARPQGCRCFTWYFTLRLVPRSLCVSSTRTYPNRVCFCDMCVLLEALRLWCWHFSWFKTDPFVTRCSHLTFSPDSSTRSLTEIECLKHGRRTR